MTTANLRTPRRMANGFCRQWVRCKECGWTGYYDYTRGGLGSPILTLPCHFPFEQYAIRITAKEAKESKRAYKAQLKSQGLSGQKE